LLQRMWLCLGLASWLVNAASGADPWSTYRGNAERTGNTDGRAGPSQPKVLWVLPTREDFVGAPIPVGDQLFIGGLGSFNGSSFHCIAADPKAVRRIAWTKTTPYLKLPMVSSPALSSGCLVFGDGMHQTDGAFLHCLRVDTGL